MNPKTKKRLQIFVPLILAVFFGWYTFSLIPVSEIIPHFKNANYTWVLLGVVFGLLSHLSRAYRWLFMLEPLGYNVKLPNSIMAVFATYLINYTIPRAGEVARASILTNYEGVPFEKGFGTIVAERIADMIVMLGIIAITFILQFDYIYQFLSEKLEPSKLIIGALVFSLVVAFVFLYIKKSISPFAKKVKVFVNGLIEGALSIFKMKKKWAFIFHTLSIWFMYVAMFYVTTFTLPQTSNLPIAAILIAFISASFTIAATNGGMFFYPAAVAAAFAIFGVAKEPGIAFGWIMWTSQTLLIILFGGLSLLYLPIYNRQKKVT